MPRTTVPLLTGETYHVFNRGVDKRVIFQDKQDYLRFYQTLDIFNTVEPAVNFRLAKTHQKSNAVREKLVDIEAYSLLPNHYHLLLKQLRDGGLSEFMLRIATGYTSYFNDKNDRTGSLFQGTYKRVHVSSSEQYQYLFAYVNENHFVHDIRIEREIFHSSSLHYQNILRSRIIKTPVESYDVNSNILLAKEIYLRRAHSIPARELFDD
jgi:REP element-mobilizing transposase RayT